MDPEVRRDINHITREIRKTHRSTRNRVLSIIKDSRFVTKVSQHISADIPIIPNERCGSWYIDPSKYETTTYFKSTDGHINNWDFSTRRLNFHILPLISKNGGAIIVDSTRRGKKMPDALSKTIPIWAAILNCIMLGPDKNYWLSTPSETVVFSERSRMLDKMPELYSKAIDTLVTGGTINKQILSDLFGGKPLVPIWVYPEFSLPPPFEKNLDYYPIYLLTASYRCEDGMDTRNGFTYVQGAADDEELWGDGFTSSMLWNNLDMFADLRNTEQDVLDLIDSLKLSNNVGFCSSAGNPLTDVPLIITPQFSIAKLHPNIIITREARDETFHLYDLVLILDESATIEEELEGKAHTEIKQFKLTSSSKKSSKILRNLLPEIMSIIESNLLSSKRILITCSTGDDLSVGVILCVLCKCYSGIGALNCSSAKNFIDKSLIRRKLVYLIELCAKSNKRINPSRATLNSVNSYLMS
ncbi:hypothetical protein CANARDRAFT_204966 [[Candida] arabinofermentans NRRL YB-2248]|uniref:Initiator tRNA phosphoribosyl transferase n=1 Tax=[Candida] arabinofermentans NRRL YB-2248 TaxID=983967 RepID=A0A1E4SSV1_9ASCO|nr:hypothetical protein CANARDRAFT_204966 [[Candida] arabinofermentans NRRL YB-2248]